MEAIKAILELFESCKPTESNLADISTVQEVIHHHLLHSTVHIDSLNIWELFEGRSNISQINFFEFWNGMDKLFAHLGVIDNIYSEKEGVLELVQFRDWALEKGNENPLNRITQADLFDEVLSRSRLAAGEKTLQTLWSSFLAEISGSLLFYKKETSVIHVVNFVHQNLKQNILMIEAPTTKMGGGVHSTMARSGKGGKEREDSMDEAIISQRDEDFVRESSLRGDSDSAASTCTLSTRKGKLAHGEAKISQKSSLKGQAAKNGSASTYCVSENEVKDVEFIQRVARDLQLVLKMTMKNMNMKGSVMEDNLKHAIQALPDIEKVFADFEEKNRLLKNKVKHLQDEGSSYSTRISELHQQLQERLKLVDEKDMLCIEQEEKIRNLEIIICNLKKDLQERQVLCENLQGSCRQLQDDIKKQSKELSNREDVISSSQKERRNLLSLKRSLEEDLSKAKATIDELKGECWRQEEKLQAMQAISLKEATPIDSMRMEHEEKGVSTSDFIEEIEGEDEFEDKLKKYSPSDETDANSQTSTDTKLTGTIGSLKKYSLQLVEHGKRKLQTKIASNLSSKDGKIPVREKQSLKSLAKRRLKESQTHMRELLFKPEDKPTSSFYEAKSVESYGVRPSKISDKAYKPAIERAKSPSPEATGRALSEGAKASYAAIRSPTVAAISSKENLSTQLEDKSKEIAAEEEYLLRRKLAVEEHTNFLRSGVQLSISRGSRSLAVSKQDNENFVQEENECPSQNENLSSSTSAEESVTPVERRKSPLYEGSVGFQDMRKATQRRERYPPSSSYSKKRLSRKKKCPASRLRKGRLFDASSSSSSTYSKEDEEEKAWKRRQGSFLTRGEMEHQNFPKKSKSFPATRQDSAQTSGSRRSRSSLWETWSFPFNLKLGGGILKDLVSCVHQREKDRAPSIAIGKRSSVDTPHTHRKREYSFQRLSRYDRIVRTTVKGKDALEDENSS